MIEETEEVEEGAAAEEGAESPDAGQGRGASAGSATAGDSESLSPKEARRRARSSHSGEARPPRTVEERIAEREEKRRRNAEQRRRWRAKSKEKRRAAGSGPREGTPRAERTGTGSPRERLGVVVSNKAEKTITVQIDTARQHRTYGKIVRSSSTLHAHDEQNQANAGDTVRVVETRPLSRTKRWRLVEVTERAR